jgi:hypothetical protein
LAINAATGQVVAPPVPTGLGEPMACAGELLEGRAVCALDGEIRLVDPSSAEVSPEPLIEDAGISAFTVFVEADRVLVAGLSVRDGSAQVAAFSPDGEELWASPLAVEGCPLATAADASFISLAHDTLRIGLGQVQALLEPGSGRSLMSACGQMGLAADGAVGLMPDEPGAATPVADTYTDARGTQHRICDFGAAGDVLPVELGSTAYFGVIGDDQLVRLFEAADCRQVWSQKDKPGQSIFQGYDSGSLYFSSVRGLTAIAVDSGGERWIARAGGGVAFRSSFVEDGWVVMITDESVIGLDPGTGEAAWTIDGFSQGAWYWVANRDGERQPLALLGPDRSHLARLDLDPLP